MQGTLKKSILDFVASKPSYYGNTSKAEMIITRQLNVEYGYFLL